MTKQMFCEMAVPEAVSDNAKQFLMWLRAEGYFYLRHRFAANLIVQEELEEIFKNNQESGIGCIQVSDQCWLYYDPDRTDILFYDDGYVEINLPCGFRRVWCPTPHFFG